MSTTEEQLAAAVRQLTDRQEIMDCLLRYTQGTDRLDPDLIRSAFHDDGIDCHGHVTGTVEDFLGWWMEGQETREATQHYITNHAVEIDGDTAHAETYFTALIKLIGNDEIVIHGGRYVDRLERRDGDWRIAVRVVVHSWNAIGDGSRMTDALQGRHLAVRGGRRDVAYERPLQPRQPPATGDHA